jgi:hypothetical protein
VRYAAAFKNVGAEAGASLGHCHSQIVATPLIPDLVQRELRGSEGDEPFPIRQEHVAEQAVGQQGGIRDVLRRFDHHLVSAGRGQAGEEVGT